MFEFWGDKSIKTPWRRDWVQDGSIVAAVLIATCILKVKVRS